MAPIAGYALQALILRRLALRLLAPGASGDSTFESVTENAWRVFLAIEQCAVTLRPLLPADGEFPELERFATADLQRSLAARSQLASIAALALEKSWKIVVLKGCVSIVEGRYSFLQDIDLLVSPELAREVAGKIRSRLGLSPGGRLKTRHLPTMGGPDALPVEVHFSLDGQGGSDTQAAWSRIVPLPGVPGLWRLAPVDHCLHVLTHTVVDHPDRRGRLRDLLVLRDALAQCSPHDVDHIVREVGKNPYAGPLLNQLTLVREWEKQAPVDPFERPAFVSYWLTEHGLPWPRRALPPSWDHIYGTVWQWIVFMSCG